MPLFHPLPAAAACLFAACLATPAHAVIGVYDKYFVSTEAQTSLGGGCCQGYHYYNSRSTNINSLPGAEFGGGPFFSPAGSTFDTSGTLTAAISDARSTGPVNGTPDSNRSIARADLSTGRLDASVTSVGAGGYVAGGAFAQVHDILNFSIAGADATTRTRITVEFVAEGSWAEAGRDIYGNGPAANVDVGLYMNNPSSAQGSLYAGASAQWTVNQPATVMPTLIGTVDQFTGAGSAFGNGDVDGAGSWAGSTATRMAFVGSFDLIGSNVTLNPTLTLINNCVFATCSFSASFRFVDLPANVSYTSDSGLFLSAVPEPGSAALMLAGLACGLLMVRRQRG